MEQRELKKINDQIRASAGFRAVLTMCDDGKKMQTLQLAGLDGEVWEGVERFQQYGFSGVPQEAEILVIPVGGDRSHLVAVAVDDRSGRKKNLAPGEVCVYHPNGDFLHFKNGNKLEQKTKESTLNAENKAETNTRDYTVAASQNASITSPQIGLTGNLSVSGKGGGPCTGTFTGDLRIIGNLHITGNLTVGGTIKAQGDVVAGEISLKNHVHGGCQGGSTGKPL